MSIITGLINGTNLNRDVHIETPPSMILTAGVRKGFTNELEVTTNSCNSGMALVEVTRTSVSPSETFLILVHVTAAEVLDTSGTGYIIVRVADANVSDGSSNSVDGTGIATIEKVSVLPSSNYLELCSLSGGSITDTRLFSTFQDNIIPYNKPFATDSEGSDAYVISITGVKAYEDGQQFAFDANTVNTGACTLNINSLGAKAILKNHSATLDNGDIAANMRVTVIYDATQDKFIMTNQIANASSFQIASQAESEAQPAIENTKSISPLRLQQFFSSRINPTVDAGETVDGTTTPQAVYVSDGTGSRTSGRFYKADANDGTNTDAINFHGFVKQSTTAGDPDNIITNGIVDGFTSLTVGAVYYLSDTAGSISTTPSTTNNQPVGRAISTTDILLQPMNKEVLHSFPSLRKHFITPAEMALSGTSTLTTATIGNNEYMYVSLAGGASESITFTFSCPDGFTAIESVELAYSTSVTKTVDVRTVAAGSGNSMLTNSNDNLVGQSLTSAGAFPPYILYNDIIAAYNGLTMSDDDIISTRIVNANGPGLQLVGVVITFSLPT